MSAQGIPVGLCQCGCGEATKPARQGDSKRGNTRGVPVKFVKGHSRFQYRSDATNAVPFKIEGELCKFIPLTSGAVAIVNVYDYAELSRFRWYAAKTKSGFYAARNAPDAGPVIFMHQQLLPLCDGREADHRNGNSLDNRRSNLRPATRQQNICNKRMGSSNTSGWKGVSWDKRKRKWRANIVAEAKQHFLGYYDDPRQAAIAYNDAAIQRFGEFARINPV